MDFLKDENGDYRTCERLLCDNPAAARISFWRGVDIFVVCGACRVESPPRHEFPP